MSSPWNPVSQNYYGNLPFAGWAFWYMLSYHVLLHTPSILLVQIIHCIIIGFFTYQPYFIVVSWPCGCNLGLTWSLGGRWFPSFECVGSNHFPRYHDSSQRKYPGSACSTFWANSVPGRKILRTWSAVCQMRLSFLAITIACTIRVHWIRNVEVKLEWYRTTSHEKALT